MAETEKEARKDVNIFIAELHKLRTELQDIAVREIESLCTVEVSTKTRK